MTRVYRYGLLAPTAGVERIWYQLRAAHRYQQQLVEIERARRAQVTALEGAHDVVRLAQVPLAEAEAVVARLLAEPRTGRRRTPAVLEALPAARLRVREARAVLQRARAAARVQSADAMRQVAEEAKGLVRAARKTSDLYWGTYLQIEQAMDAARKSPTPPRFPAWRGEGRLAVQCQHGLDPAGLTDDRRVQITEAQPVPGRTGKPRPRLRLRIGSNDRDPIWGEWPVMLHRPIPAEARIMWAVVVVRQVAGRAEWSLHLTLALPDTWQPESCGEGVVAVDLGWRAVERTRRAGGWTDGTTTEDILIEPQVIGAQEKSEDLRSIRDRAIPAIREMVRAWRDAQDVLPAEHGERLRLVGTWQAPRRFGALARWWRDHRVAGDEAVYQALVDWRRQDTHLWRWEAHGRQTALARRRDEYRVLAATLARRYRTLVIERLDLSAMARKHAGPGEQQANSQRHETAASVLRTSLMQAFRARGGEIVTVAPCGPAASVLAAYREGRGVVEMPAAAREAKFTRIAREKRERAVTDGDAARCEGGPLA